MEKELLKGNGKKVVEKLKKIYGEPKPALNYKTTFELLIAVILSAQCTDKRVNIVTEELFKKYSTPSDFAEAYIEDIEEMIKSTGFYKNKAANIKKCSIQIIENYEGDVPSKQEELVKLAGVGRKTANVVLGHIYNIPGIVVDTHVKRLSNKIGFTDKKDPVKIESELMEIIEEKDWFLFSNLLIYHGRSICKARKPMCEQCDIKKLCDYGRMAK